MIRWFGLAIQFPLWSRPFGGQAKHNKNDSNSPRRFSRRPSTDTSALATSGPIAALDESCQAGGCAAVVFPAADVVGPVAQRAVVPVDVSDGGTAPFEKSNHLDHSGQAPLTNIFL